MAHSPENADDLSAAGDYERGWEALGALLARGRSFSGREKNVALLNLRAPPGQALFADVSAPLGLDQIDDSRCVIPADWDGDGDLDLWYANRTGPRLKFFRNGLPPPPRWIAFTGIGQRANRDAIGLRIELHLKSTAGERRTLWRSLRAGDSFLSQTPKILHFAYREDEVIDRITFRWPAPGKKQSLSPLPPNIHYTVTETDSETPSVKPAAVEPLPRLRPAAVAAAEAPGAAAAAAAPAPSDSGRSGAVRARILERPALPPLGYYTFDGKQRELSDFVRSEAAEAVLVVVQAAWCAPCQKEMSELVARAADFQKARISVLSLAVDAARPDAARDDVAAAQAFIERLRWPFAAGLAPEATLKGLAAINARTLYPERDLPLPSAWLLDRNGRVAVIYQGALRPDDVLADFDGMNSVPPSPAWAFPFPGRMAGPLFRPTPAGLAQAWLQAGEPELARHELENALAALVAQPIDAPGVRSSLVECHALLGETELAADRPAEAAAALRAALSVLPDGHAARRALAVRLWKAGDVTLATSELDRLAATAATSGQVSLIVELARSWRELQEPRRSWPPQPRSHRPRMMRVSSSNARWLAKPPEISPEPSSMPNPSSPSRSLRPDSTLPGCWPPAATPPTAPPSAPSICSPPCRRINPPAPPSSIRGPPPSPRMPGFPKRPPPGAAPSPPLAPPAIAPPPPASSATWKNGRSVSYGWNEFMF